MHRYGWAAHSYCPLRAKRNRPATAIRLRCVFASVDEIGARPTRPHAGEQRVWALRRPPGSGHDVACCGEGPKPYRALRKGRTRALARPSRRSPTASYRVPPNGTLRMLSRLVGVVIMGHSAHRAIAGYARPPQAPRPSLCNGPERRAIADSERNPSEAGSLARGARRRALGGSGDRPVARALR